LEYLMSPESTAHADPEKASLAASGRAVQRLLVDQGSLR
jgi:hypothetical protein